MRNDRGHLSDNAGAFKVGNMLTRLYGFGLDHFTLFEGSAQLRSLALDQNRQTDGIRNDDEGRQERKGNELGIFTQETVEIP